ncbi:helix-turn-helix domain-containing protein [Flavobacterium sp. DG1-102-2]|uniref:helix-turn-helix domain-containing protein n=1 Tax=Flavobacterium sp. DG1-102-2 TaxID=3081663 RepID=UPI003981D1B0
MGRKVKYSYEFKLRCVEEALNKNRSIKSVATEEGLNLSNLKFWISFYNKYGAKGLIPRQTQSYTLDFRCKVLDSISKKFLSLNEACLEFNIPSRSTIINWQQRFEHYGIEGLLDKPRGRPKSMTYKRAKKKSDKPLTREEELLLEIESLRAENALLKKLQALIQAKEAERNKKRKP